MGNFVERVERRDRFRYAKYYIIAYISGCGMYDDEGCGIKIGKWTDLDEGFSSLKPLTYEGEYKNGKKVGRWDILIMRKESQKIEQIGGGSYDASGNGIKIGKWVDLDDGFYDNKQVTYNGEYKNGHKVGRWEIWYQELFSNNQQIGGGSYDASGNGIKIGKWVDLDDGFCCDKQITYNGEYKNGDKVGRWEIYYRAPYGEIQLIGGGLYDDRDYGIKTGNWVGISEKFLVTSQVTYNGQYKNGYKVGKWNISFRINSNEPFSIIGGGSYDQNCLEVKIGKWTQLDNWFDYLKQVTYHGEYMNGKKVGRWVEIDIKKNKKKNETNYNI